MLSRLTLQQHIYTQKSIALATGKEDWNLTLETAMKEEEMI